MTNRMRKRLSEAEIARYERDGFLFPVEARRIRLLALIACLMVASCTGVGYQPPPTDQSGPIHGESGGGGGGGSM